MDTNVTKQEKRQLRQLEKETEIRQLKKKRMLKRAAVWTVLFLVLGGGLYGLTRMASSPAEETALLGDSVSDQDWTKGSKEAKVVLIEYSDFQCPACAVYYPLVKRLGEELGSQVLIVYRHFPLIQHKNAPKAAYAAEAAGRQGKFWEMHDMIFERQKSWEKLSDPGETFRMYAQELGLDMAKFSADYDSDEIEEKVKNHYSSGVRSRVNSTPTFFLNGKKLMNTGTYDEFKSIVVRAIEDNS